MAAGSVIIEISLKIEIIENDNQLREMAAWLHGMRGGSAGGWRSI
jgi:hypothetical protein